MKLYEGGKARQWGTIKTTMTETELVEVEKINKISE